MTLWVTWLDTTNYRKKYHLFGSGPLKTIFSFPFQIKKLAKFANSLPICQSGINVKNYHLRIMLSLILRFAKK